MSKVIVGLLLLMILAGCDNPLGATDRQSIRANAYVEAARLEADAKVAVAEQETVRASIWASMVIPGLLILVGGVVAGIVVWWQGRIWLARAERTGPTAPAQLPITPSRQLTELRRLAASQGYDVEVVDSVAYLVDDQGNRVGRRLLTGG